MFSFALIVIVCAAALSRAQECDSETTRTCGECLALTEFGATCNYCKADRRCVGTFDLTSAFSCTGGFTKSAAACTAAPVTPAPTPAPECDGETTRTCEECVALTETLTSCNFCKSDKRCQGDLDISTSFACAGGYSKSAADCKATPAPPSPTTELVCDGETTRTCEECVALTEGIGTRCNFCKADKRCQGDLDVSTSFSCTGGYTTDAAGCSATPAPAPEPYCDGEVTTCAVCTSKSEFGLGKCNWCADTGKCQGNVDLSNFNGACPSGFKGTCNDVTSDPNYKYDCEQCPSNCNSDCAKMHSNGLTFCLRGDLQIINGMCKTNASATGCCGPAEAGATPMPKPSGPLRPAFANICFEYRAGCDNAADFCAYKAKYMACTTRSDRCGDYNVLSAQFDSKCPAIKCECSSVPNSCLADGSQVAVQCTAPGQVQIQGDNCSQCKDCECEKRCCTSTCSGKSMGVETFNCDENNGVTKPSCKCGGKASDATANAAVSLLAMAAVAGAVLL